MLSKNSPTLFCSSNDGSNKGIEKNTESFIEKRSDLAPLSPLKNMKVCQQELLKYHSKKSTFTPLVLNTV